MVLILHNMLSQSSIFCVSRFKQFLLKATSVRGVTLTAAHLGSFLNFAQLGCIAKFKIEPKCAAVKVMPLTEVALATITKMSILNIFNQMITNITTYQLILILTYKE